jgi:hypothetical protein
LNASHRVQSWHKEGKRHKSFKLINPWWFTAEIDELEALMPFLSYLKKTPLAKYQIAVDEIVGN